MSALINLPRAAWKRQPQGPVAVNWGNPLTKGLCYLFSHEKAPLLHDLVSSRIFMSGAEASMGVSVNRVVYKQTNRTLLSGFQPIQLDQDQGLTVVCWANPVRSSTRAVLVCQRAGGFTNEIELRANSDVLGLELSGGLWWVVTNSSDSETSYAAGAIDGQYHIFCGLRYSDGSRKIFRDALDITTTAGTNSGSPIGRSNLCLGGLSESASIPYNGSRLLDAAWGRPLSIAELKALNENPYQLIKPRPSRFYLIPSSGGATTYTDTLSIDALIQRSGLTQSTTIDALLQSAFSRSLSLDGLIAAVQTGVISLDALLQIVGTRTVSMDALLQATKAGTVSVDALVQMTLSQSLSLDALIVAASASSASVSLDALIQSLKTAGLSLDALLSKSMSATSVIDALIQASKAGTVSLDAIIAGSSSSSIFVGLDALIQAIQSKTLSLDALLQKTYTNMLSLDAYVALTRVQSVSLDALIQASKTGVVSLDALIQMTRTVTVSFDALIQSAKTGVISLDAILIFATQASLLLDAYVQKTLSRGIGLDAIIGSIADMILPTGRVISVPSSDRWVFVTHADRFIQVQ